MMFNYSQYLKLKSRFRFFLIDRKNPFGSTEYVDVIFSLTKERGMSIDKHKLNTCKTIYGWYVNDYYICDSEDKEEELSTRLHFTRLLTFYRTIGRLRFTRKRRIHA